MKFDLMRRSAAEALGTFFLVMAVVGSGIMAEKLASGNQAIALLCNTLPTGAVLFVIITILGDQPLLTNLDLWVHGLVDRMRSEWNGRNRVVAHRYSVVYHGRTGKILHEHKSRAIFCRTFLPMLARRRRGRRVCLGDWTPEEGLGGP